MQYKCSVYFTCFTWLTCILWTCCILIKHSESINNIWSVLYILCQWLEIAGIFLFYICVALTSDHLLIFQKCQIFVVNYYRVQLVDFCLHFGTNFEYGYVEGQWFKTTASFCYVSKCFSSFSKMSDLKCTWSNIMQWNIMIFVVKVLHNIC